MRALLATFIFSGFASAQGLGPAVQKPAAKPAFASLTAFNNQNLAAPSSIRAPLPAKAKKKSVNAGTSSQPKLVSIIEARDAYDRGDYDKAISLYEGIKPEQKEFLRSREELAWAYLMDNRLSSLRGMLPHLNSGLVPLRWRMEGRVLSSMIYLRDCQYSRVAGELKKFQTEMTGLARQIDKGVARGKDADYFQALNAEMKEAILKMKFVKMELRSRLVMLSRKTMGELPEGPKQVSEKYASNVQTYPVNGDIWVDEIFLGKGESSSLCPSLHKVR